MKVSVVIKTNDSERYSQLRIVGVWSDYCQACEWCNIKDPDEEIYEVDEFEVDKLISD